MLNKKLLMVMTGALVLSACGKNDFNGTYSGYETATQGTSQTQQYPNQYGYGQQPTPVTLSLKQDDEFVTGSYSGNGISGQFTASAKDADKLDNVQLVIGYGNTQNANTSGYGNMGYSYGMSCTGVFTGSLSAPDDGRRLNGTLNMVGGGYSGYGCSGKTLMLNKNGE